jgi:hypothetical protein
MNTIDIETIRDFMTYTTDRLDQISEEISKTKSEWIEVGNGEYIHRFQVKSVRWREEGGEKVLILQAERTHTLMGELVEKAQKSLQLPQPKQIPQFEIPKPQPETKKSITMAEGPLPDFPVLRRWRR